MNKYESIIICKPISNNSYTYLKEIDDICNKVKEITGDDDLKIIKVGQKKLVYNIKGFNEGYYIEFNFKAECGVVFPLDKYYRENDNILKFITMRMED